ncbi:MAG TPA: glucoamylase family protein [Pyrinomonadaceae bacterium]|nr:glucoamylase family protein [Pyrinomonadaceae bacterium]
MAAPHSSSTSRLAHVRFLRIWATFIFLLLSLPNPVVPASLQSNSIAPLHSSLAAARDEEFTEDLERRSFRYFREQADARTGLVNDRARADGSEIDENHRNVASIAATGFGLTALCIAAERGWITQSEARERVRSSLSFFASEAAEEHGWFYHWMDARTGARRWQSEVSSIDTALLLGGILTARGYFRNDREIVRLATRIYNRVDFHWMLNNHPTLLSHGWKPETGFLKPRWDTYSEDTILYLLAIGSPTHPIQPRSWYAIRRDHISFAGYNYVGTVGVPLFMHQYAHAWIDYRGRRERRGDHVDYFQNSIEATRAHKAFCLSLSGEFPGYTENVWGITASDSARGYLAWGGPPRDPAIDGTVVPSAAGGSLMFTPEISLAALRTMRDKFGERVYGKYGFVDAFNPNNGWVDADVIGINVGIILLSAENMRSANVWRWFMRNQEIEHAMRAIELLPYRQRAIHRKRQVIATFNCVYGTYGSQSQESENT